MAQNSVQIDPFAIKYVRFLRGTVVDNKDPKKQSRVRVRILSLHGDASDGIKDNQLPWALPLMLGASYNSGTLVVPEINSVVGVLFENGDKDSPVYIGSLYASARPKAVEFSMSGGLKRKGAPNRIETPRDIRNLDTRVLYRSPKGNRIVMRDDDGNECMIVSDQFGQAFFAQAHCKPNSVADLEKINDKDDGTEGKQPDSNGNTSEDREKLSLAVGDPVIGFRGTSGSSMKITSSKKEAKVEVFSEGKQNASMVMKSDDTKSSVTQIAGGPLGLWKVTQDDKKWEVKGPLSRITMTVEGVVTIEGLQLNLQAPNAFFRTTNFTHTSTTWEVLSGLALILDKCPSEFVNQPNMIQSEKQTYPDLNKKKDEASNALNNSALSDMAEGCNGSTGCSGAGNAGQAVKNSDSLSSTVDEILQKIKPGSKSFSRSTTSVGSVLSTLEQLKEDLSEIKALSDAVIAAERVFQKTEEVLKFAKSVEGKNASYLNTPGDDEALSNDLSSIASGASGELSETLLSLSTALQPEFSKEDLIESLKNLENVAEYQTIYRDKLQALAEKCESAYRTQYALKNRVSINPTSDTTLNHLVASLSFEPIHGELYDKIAKITTNVGNMEEAVKEYRQSTGYLLHELWEWADQSFLLGSVLNKTFDIVLGDSIRNRKTVARLESYIKTVEDEAVKEKIQTAMDECRGKTKHWDMAGEIVNGKPIFDAIFEEDRATGKLSDEFRRVLVTQLGIDIVSKVLEEVKQNYKSNKEVAQVLRDLGCQVTTV